MEDFLQDCWKAILDYWFLLLTLIITILMAVLRTAKQHGKVDWIEAIICGIFALSVWLILGWFNIPESAGIGCHYETSYNAKRNVYRGKETKETYKLENGSELPLPKYYHDKIYT